MFLELIATFVAGIAAAGVMLLLNKGMGGRLPRWLIPVAAGAAMIAATISNEYGWYGRTTSGLPSEIVVAQTVESKAMYRPWTYLHPFVTRFMAVDTASIRTNPAVPDQKMVDLLFFGRWSPVRSLPVLVDCANRRQALLAAGAAFDEAGQVTDAVWSALAPEHGLFVALCVEAN
ncbi:hypothetical protein TG4357_00106 [Thalassovita gelatinovora]|uniref:Uncharacterized protein n=1 Tax=Thalassovita gelatinovora TaxID=53501 RepID=A0A0P1F4X4_THAGE|nr:hypothetical protein [Thalassovita gelatinovora]QIZ79252.1 hypothetical protein HFZ77_01585 [Thalassovita gelatinovora]CUH62440.1 hypothetical protein TG4357_00106 [Thalassovita gelatinovora]SEQ04353.1 hypothetical protein SAMN04488043_1036 [Thalassovita gelatinovora]